MGVSAAAALVLLVGLSACARAACAVGINLPDLEGQHLAFGARGDRRAEAEARAFRGIGWNGGAVLRAAHSMFLAPLDSQLWRFEAGWLLRTGLPWAITGGAEGRYRARPHAAWASLEAQPSWRGLLAAKAKASLRVGAGEAEPVLSSGALWRPWRGREIFAEYAHRYMYLGHGRTVAAGVAAEEGSLSAAVFLEFPADGRWDVGGGSINVKAVVGWP